MQLVSKLLDKLKTGEFAIGTTDTIASSRLLEVMGFAGLDMVKVDQMFCPADWPTIAEMVRAGRNYDIDVFVRVQSFPWIATTDPRIAVDAVRALGVGAAGVVFSCATVQEVEQVVAASRDWHRDIHIHPFSDEEFAAFEAKVGSDCLVMPLIESQSALDDIDSILAVDGLKAVSLGMTDISRVLGHPLEYEHPDVQRVVDTIVKKAHAKGVYVGANVGYSFSRSFDEMVARVGRMREHGLQFAWMQNTGYLIQWAYRTLVQQMRSTVGSGLGA